MEGEHLNGGGSSRVVEIYPLNRYYFSSKEAAVLDKHGAPEDRIQRLRSNYAARGLRTCVQGVLLVELFQQPHVLLLQVRNSIFCLPGGRLRPGESDTDGLKRKLSRRLSHNDSDSVDDDWAIGECIGMWWRSDFETLPYPYMPRKYKDPTTAYLHVSGGPEHDTRNLQVCGVVTPVPIHLLPGPFLSFAS